MRLIQNMTTIAECPTPEYTVPHRVIKIAVVGGSGVGKTGKRVNVIYGQHEDFLEFRSNLTVVAFLRFSAGGEIPNEALHRGLREECW